VVTKKSSEAAKNSWLNLWKFVQFEAIFFKSTPPKVGAKLLQDFLEIWLINVFAAIYREFTIDE
jgi:hypothetical protein